MSEILIADYGEILIAGYVWKMYRKIIQYLRP